MSLFTLAINADKIPNDNAVTDSVDAVQSIQTTVADDVYIVAEDTTQRGEFEKHYLCSDGSFIAVSYPEAVHYQDQSGKWIDVDNTLSLNNLKQKYESNNGNFHVSFAKNATQSQLLSLKKNGFELSWSLMAEKSQSAAGTDVATEDILMTPQNAPSVLLKRAVSLKSINKINESISDSQTFVLSDTVSKIQYTNLFGTDAHVSVNYSVFQNKIEEDIYLNSKSDVSSFTMNFDSNGLTPVLNADHSIDFVYGNYEMRYHIGVPYMVDASNEVLSDIAVTVEETNAGCNITYTPESAWLQSEERVYPILLDPSITTNEYNSSIEDTYVTQGDIANHSSEQMMYLGIKSGKISRSFIKIKNLPVIDASMPILEAKMTVTMPAGTSTGKQVAIYKATSNWSSGAVTYANMPSSLYLASSNFNAATKVHTFNLTNNVSQLYDEYYAAVNYGYMLRYADESTTNPDYNIIYSCEYTDKASRPYLTIKYGYTLPSGLTENATYKLENVNSSHYVTVHNGIDANTTNIYQMSDGVVAGPIYQKFKLVPSTTTTGSYLFRAICSSSGTNRLLDIVKGSDGVVSNGDNVQLYTYSDAISEEWLIIALDNNQFKIVPRTNMSVALSACGTSNGSSGGTLPTSAGNVFVATYTGGSNQKWYFVDSSGNTVQHSGSQVLQNGVYYFNNQSSGQYLHNNNTSTVNSASGLISSLGNTIRWKVTGVGNNQYTIQPLANLSMFVGRTSATNIGFINTSSGTNIPASCLWTIKISGNGGVYVSYIYNGTTYYLRGYTSSVGSVTSRGAVGSDSYLATTWRVASTSFYGNTSSSSNRELSAYSNFPDYELKIGQKSYFNIDKYYNYEMWCDSSTDFSYSISQQEKLAISSGKLNAIERGVVTVTATHKVTNRVLSFTVTISNLTVYQTRNKEYLGFENQNDITPITAEDLQYAQKSKAEMISNGTLISLADFYENGSPISLSKRITTIKNFFNSQINYDSTFERILDEMLDHFVQGSGADYSNSNLTNAVKNHQNTTNYINGVISLIKNYLSHNNGDISGLYYDSNLWVQPALRDMHPLVSEMQDEKLYLPSYGHNNGVPGLSLAINGWYGNKIEIESYTVSGNMYSGTLRVVFYDHFGLDTPDLSQDRGWNMQAGMAAGFRQWYILQHWDSLGATPQPKPYVTIVSYTVSFSGTL